MTGRLTHLPQLIRLRPLSGLVRVHENANELDIMLSQCIDSRSDSKQQRAGNFVKVVGCQAAAVPGHLGFLFPRFSP
jgi:hypothetical protein